MSVKLINERLDECMQNMRQYLVGEQSQVQSCFEIIQLAFSTDDEDAYQAWYKILSWRVEIAIRSHSLSEKLDEDIDYFINQIIARFWKSVRPKYDEFTSAPAYFAYLRMCVNAELVDHARKQKVHSSLDVVPPLLPLSQNCTEEQIWEIILKTFEKPEQQLLCELIYRFEMRPREIIERYPEKWTNKKKVYYLVYEINKRLRQHPELMDCLGLKPEQGGKQI